MNPYRSTLTAGPHPVKRGEEILVSYGKGFWANRVGDLAAFTGNHADHVECSEGIEIRNVADEAHP